MKTKYKRQNKCACCNRPTMIFMWSSSRAFVPYRDKLLNLLTHLNHAKLHNPTAKKEADQAISFGLPICFDCIEKFNKGGRIIAY